jgi:predicted nucleic acid-binding Zn ribbon protein
VSTWRPAGPPAWELDPRPVGESLDRVTRSIGVPMSAVLATVFSRWEEIVGREIAGHARPRSLREGVLVVVVDQPAWAGQLRFLTADMLRRLEAAVGPGQVSEIQLRVGSDTRPEARPGTRRNPGHNHR